MRPLASTAGRPAHEDEQSLIQTAQRGGLEAFNALILRYQDSVYGVVYRIMGEPASSEDVTQSAFITAYRHLNSFRGGNFKSWLLRIATNQSYDELRRLKRRPATSFEDLPGGDTDEGAPLPDPGDTPEQIAQQNELQRAIRDCINSLGDDHRLVLTLSDLEGLSYQEIAESLGANLGTIKSRLSRARAAVRDCLRAVQELLPAEYRLTDDA